MRQRLLAGLAVAVLLALVAAAPSLVDEYWLGVLTQGLIFALLAASLDVLVGYGGLPSLCHGALAGVSSYTVAIVSLDLGWAPLLAVLAGIACATLIGALFAPVALRGRGVFFLVLTLSFGQVLWGVASTWESLTGGSDGLPGVIRPVIAGIDLFEPSSFYYVVSIVVGLGLACLWSFVHSPAGLALQGVRDSESRMAQLGYRPAGYRWLAFTLAAAFSGVAGVLSVYDSEFVGPESVYFTVSAIVLLMVILGGSGTLWGPALAAVLLVMVETFVSDRTERWTLVLGALYVLVVLVAPRGLLRLVSDGVRRLGAGSGAATRAERT